MHRSSKVYIPIAPRQTKNCTVFSQGGTFFCDLRPFHVQTDLFQCGDQSGSWKILEVTHQSYLPWLRWCLSFVLLFYQDRNSSIMSVRNTSPLHHCFLNF